MTIHDVASQLHSLSKDHRFNGVKHSVKSLERYISTMFRTPLKGGNKLVMDISLPDRGWMFYVIEYAPGEFDYYIPDTREQEKRVIAILN